MDIKAHCISTINTVYGKVSKNNIHSNANGHFLLELATPSTY